MSEEGTPKIYSPSDEEIAILKKQIAATDEQAMDLLLKYHGNHVLAMMDFHKVKAPQQDYTDLVGHSTVAKENTEMELNEEQTYKYISDVAPVLDLLGNNSKNQIMNDYRTHIIIDLDPSTVTFSKRKRFASLAEIVEEYRTHLTPPENQLGLNIYPVQGELLFKWSMMNAGLVIYASQIRANSDVVSDNMLNRINKSATLIARSCGHIADNHCIIDGAFLINNLNWSHPQNH